MNTSNTTTKPDEDESPVLTAIREFLHLESAGSILLIVGVILALLAVNSPLEPYYNALLNIIVEVRIGALGIEKPLLLWINDGLMAIFFFLVGLELKREVLEGELSNPAQIVLPVMAALGGMAAPAIIYAMVNFDHPAGLKGWAIPSATDIAIALGVLSLLGKRVPNSLKLFLLTLAIVDDLGAIVIIALFYSSDLSTTALSIAAICLLLLTILNLRNVLSTAPYLLLGFIMWAAVLKSGVHATLAGVLLAFFIPLRGSNRHGGSPLHELEEDLHPTVAFGVLPIFAFANSGISFSGLSVESLLQPIPLGIALGLFFGNQIGVMGMSWLTVKLGLAKLPDNVRWDHIYGVSLLCGIGFTMSLFISGLAFEQGGPAQAADDRLGIFFGSLLAAVCGYFWLRWRLPKAS